MEVVFVTGARGWRRRAPTRTLIAALALLLIAAGAVRAQSVLGTIRGTVTDNSGAVIPKAAVLITDEATGTPRALETDARGNYEAPNLLPGIYRIEVMVTNFKKFERTGVRLSTGGVALVNVQLEVGPMSETVQVTATAPANVITLDSPSVSRGLDEQQLRDLPRSSRDIQSFLYLNPNVIGTSDDMQFLGGRTYGVSYVQDGQASTNAIFGTVGNSAPGLDAVQEMQVLSNSYSAEYGGLAGVVVTTKRGGQQYHGSAFWDFNSNELNSLSLGQVLSGVTRNDPNSETSQNRYGATVGGPIRGRTFFFGNFEGSRTQSIQGGGRAYLPTEAMRRGDFSAAPFIVKDPDTGKQFPNNIIPPERIDPSATKIMDFFWPLPNQSYTSHGFGVFQQYVPELAARQRFDLRVDHEQGNNNQFFGRVSYQHRSPTGFTTEINGNAITTFGADPFINSYLDTWAGIGGWTSILKSTLVNELRVGYNYDHSERSSQYRAVDVAAQLGIEAPPSIGPDVPGFPSMQFQGTSWPSGIADSGRNTNRLQSQNSFSIADNLSWLKGPHSMRMGVLVNRNSAIDGFGRGLNHRGQYVFNGKQGTGNQFTDFLLGRVWRANEHVSTRGDLDGHSTDFASFFQDDWRVNQALTLFLGLRYEFAGAWHENSLMLANFQAEKAAGGFHVVPNEEVRSKLPPDLINPDYPWATHVKLASEAGLPVTLVKTDFNNFSPRLGMAYRLDPQGKNVLRAGFGLFHPTTAVQGLRDQLAANEFRYTKRRQPAGPLQHAFSEGELVTFLGDFGTQGVWPNVQSPDIYQYNVTFERELGWEMGFRASYLGSTMRKLLVNNEYNSVPASTNTICVWCVEDNYKRPFPLYGPYMNMIENTGDGQFHALQIEVTRRFKKGFAIDGSYTYAHSRSNAPDSGNSSLGVIQYDPYNLEYDRASDPYVANHRVMLNATVDLPFGKGRKYAANMPAWEEALFGGWTVSAIFQARTGAHLTPFFSLGSSSYTPYNTGFVPDVTGVWTGEAYAPNQVGDPMKNIPAGLWFNPAAYEMPGPGVFPGTTKRNSFTGPGNWIVNLAVYKDIIARHGMTVQFTAVVDNVFNIPQFFPGPGSDFINLTDYLAVPYQDGRSPTTDDMYNGTLGVLGSSAEGNVEGFALSRQIRLGVRVRF